MQIIMTPEAEVETFKRLEAQKYKANWAHYVAQWLLRIPVLIGLATGIGLLNYLWYKNGVSASLVNGILITAFAVWLPGSFAKGPGAWQVSNTRLRFVPGAFPAAGTSTFDWELEALRRDGSSEDLATVLWLIEHTRGGDVRHGIAMWTPKPREPKASPARQKNPQTV